MCRVSIPCVCVAGGRLSWPMAIGIKGLRTFLKNGDITEVTFKALPTL